jgi:integrase
MQDVLRLEDGRLVVFRRGGKYHARICTGPNQYLWRSLKTGNRDVASKAGLRLYHQIALKSELGIPAASRTINEVLDEYVAFRTRQCEQGNTSEGMLRQVLRVVKFWREYAGKRPITTLDNAALKEFVTWRRDYYVHRPQSRMPRNAKRHPTDKEIVYNLTIMRAVLRWAHERGYMGSLPVPTYTFTAKTKRVRPAFEVREYRRLLQGLLRWERSCERPELLTTRQVLRDYVLILANSGMRVGEANNLRNRDVLPFTDAWGRKNYRFIVRGKTGERDVIPRLRALRWIERVMSRKTDPKPDDWFFSIREGKKVITLIDQFDKVLRKAGIEHNSAGDKYSLYSLRHFYAVMGLRSGIGVFDIARNMGTSIQMIQQYYGKQATPMSMATTLGGAVRRSAVGSTRQPINPL